VPFRVLAFTSQFRDTGFKYSTMDAEQKDALEDQDGEPTTAVEFEPGELDRLLFNRDTTRDVWRSLMDHGLRDATGSRVGKTIVFARNHLHAVTSPTSSPSCTRSTARPSARSSTTRSRAPSSSSTTSRTRPTI
jgi:hypothetical protein